MARPGNQRVLHRNIATVSTRLNCIALSFSPEEMLRLNVKPEEYLDKLVEYCNMKIYAIATVVDTNETWGEEDDFQVLKPNLDIGVSA
jgi:transglutaminase 1